MMGRAVEIARKYDLDIIVKSSFNYSPGTRITREDKLEKVVITGVAANKNVAMITIFGLNANGHIVLQRIAQLNINIILLTVSQTSNRTTVMSIVVKPGDVVRITKTLDELMVADHIEAYEVNADVAKVSIVGSGIATHSGVAFDMFDSLHHSGIDILMSSTSEIKIAAIIPKEEADVAVRALHQTFNLNGIHRKELEVIDE